MKIEDVKYIPFSKFLLTEKVDDITRYLQLAAEFGCSVEGEEIYNDFQKDLEKTVDRFQKLVLQQKDEEEPDEFDKILQLRPDGPRKMIEDIPEDYMERLRGAFYGRMAGCTLGAALEFQPIEAMKAWAEYFGDDFPLTDYWSRIKDPLAPHYVTAKKIDLTKGNMDAVPPDDDTIYTLLGMLTMEKYGTEFTCSDMGEIWKEYLPLGIDEDGAPGKRGCWWGERKMLQNLWNGLTFPEAGLKGNPNLQNIAAWTRADSYGYVFPGWPEKAAEMAYKDASANHRRNGVYGAMFMAATIAAAFVVKSPIEAIEIGLTEIPRNCMFAEAIRWALKQKITNYQDAADIAWKKYEGMFNGSAITNAIHVVMGLMIGKTDFTKVIGETIAMSGDNDCTGATAGSIAGAIIGMKNIPKQWTEPFNGRMHIYLKHQPEYLEIEEVCQRLKNLAEKFRCK